MLPEVSVSARAVEPDVLACKANAPRAAPLEEPKVRLFAAGEVAVLRATNVVVGVPWLR